MFELVIMQELGDSLLNFHLKYPLGDTPFPSPALGSAHSRVHIQECIFGHRPFTIVGAFSAKMEMNHCPIKHIW